MKPILPFAAFGLCSLFTGLAPAQVPVATAAGTRDFKVSVVDAVTRRPIAGAQVSRVGPNALKANTDEHGVVVLPLPTPPSAPEKHTLFTIAVEHAEYETRYVEWFSDAGRVLETVPASHEVALRVGATAGGVVRDEQGAPVVGARVVIYASGLRGRALGRGDKLQQEYGVVSTGESDTLLTDEQGRWRRAHFPDDITQLSIDIIRPEGARTRFISGRMFRGPNERGGTVEVDDLLRQTTVFPLQHGVTVRGVVVDEAGRPLGGVQLRLRDAAGRSPPHTFFNLPDGTFTLPHWDADSVLVTAEKDGFQGRSITIALGPDAAPGKIVLPAAKPLLIRVVMDDGSPVANAEVQSDSNPSSDQIVQWKTKTDAQGRAAWPTATNLPVNVWIHPPAGTDHPFRSARLLADGTEQVIRVRRGADKSIRVQFRVVDGQTGAHVPKFEIWRRLANQPFQPWGMPAENGAATREMSVTELPNGFVPSYRLQVRAAGYTGWSSETLEFSHGDQDLTLKLARGESTLAQEPPPSRSPGVGLDGARDPQLLVLAGEVARLLETGDVEAFVGATNVSLDDWRRLLPQGASDSDLPLGPDPMRVVRFRAAAITASAQHVLEQARRAGVTPGRIRFTVKSATAPMAGSSGFKIADRPVRLPFTRALRIVLTGEPAGDAGVKTPRGDYELNLGSVQKFPGGWRAEEGVRWTALPDGAADDTLRRELSLANRIAPVNLSDQRTLSGMDDPALLQLGAAVTDFIRQRAPAGFVQAVRLSRDATADFYVRTGREVTPELDEAYARISTGLAAAADAMVALQERMGIDLRDAKLTVTQVLAERPSFMRFGQVSGISSPSVRVIFAAESERRGRSGQPLAGSYTVTIGNAMRVGERWVLVDDKIRFQDFPPGLIAGDEKKHVELENYIAEHRTLPPGHTAPDVSFVNLADNTTTKLSAHRGKVVVLEFWAVWCGPCQEPMEKLQHLRDAYPEWKDRVEVIALSIDDRAEVAREHLGKKGWTKTTNVWAGEGAWQEPAPQAFRVRGVPTVYVLDRAGRVVQAGHPAALNLARVVNAELEKPAP